MAEQGINRREFVKAGLATGGVLAGMGIFDQASDAATRRGSTGRSKSYRQPNIVFIVIDEMRFPSVFPTGVSTPEEWVSQFMPNLFTLWQHGVKFGHHYSAGVACSPSRGAFVTGLYPHQQWMLQTRKGAGSKGPPSPALKAAFPTYGKLLRTAGYETPYVGKWHLSTSPTTPTDPKAATWLQDYGFQGLTVPDIVGVNGDGATYDGGIAQTAATWLRARKPTQGPFCLTTSFVNPHDRMYFWGGIYADRFNALYQSAGVTPMATYPAPVPAEQNPPSYGYPALPPNWESLKTLEANKPTTQSYVKQFSELVFGGITDDPTKTGATDFSMAEYPLGTPGIQAAFAPYTYWQQGLDCYTHIMSMVDAHIGTVVQAVPKDLLGNTVFVFTSDHGDYSGAHGLEMNKMGTGYEEAFNVPLVVADPSGRFAGDTDRLRTQLTSNVDLLPMFATLGTGDKSWMSGDLAQVYAERLDLLPLVRSSRAAGRDHLVMATDEVVPDYFNFNHSPMSILVYRTEAAKLVVYSDWYKGTTTVDPTSNQYEFYDYSTERGRLELDSQPDDPRAKAMATKLFSQAVPTQMQQPLPGAYGQASEAARVQYLGYVALLNKLAGATLTKRNLNLYTDWGNPF